MLSECGASVLDTGVSGRYHAPAYEGVPEKILAVCPVQYKPEFEGQSLVRSNADGDFISVENATLSMLKCILTEPADWFATMSNASSRLQAQNPSSFILSFGTDAVPKSIGRTHGVRKAPFGTEGTAEPESSTLKARQLEGYPEDAIAIIGMSGRFPGSDSLFEFWECLESGKCMVSQMDPARFGKTRSSRSPSTLTYWGNFLEDVQSFDHGFFKKSPREAVSMDPQQRILLQIAYEALETSGYFASQSKPEDIGVYLGACSADYDFNLACHPPTAYSATGTLRSFLSGKLSHYFGWSGPSLVLDTACSSSAVAIHTACTALRTGQCLQALAGGINLITSPYLYENFSAAHFLSATGNCKPFSADADGYCRGEGGGLVLLKRLSEAVADNDRIFGVIAGSAVNQNDNCVPITVPHTSSQGNLYSRVTKQAGIAPNQVSFVEAHGTGTPVGDPIEMESIRRIFGGSKRQDDLFVSSVKGNIGHLEGASGVAALIKVILQMEKRLAPPQASFKSLNPKMSALEPDKIRIPTSTANLPQGMLTACVNNYGAAGSNAAMIVLQPPPVQKSEDATKVSQLAKIPIQIAASSATALVSYCKTLDELCGSGDVVQYTSGQQKALADIAYSLSIRLNPDHLFLLTIAPQSISELQSLLRGQTTNSVQQRPKAKPVVLCFGGQVSDKVALDERCFQDFVLFRNHLDECDKVLLSLGFPSLYPGIFQTQSLTDVVVLHSILFATQYASAKAWIDSGLKVTTLVGHSFGQLTAMAVSGVLSLRDGLRLVAGRAALMKKLWGPEKGTMIAVEADLATIRELQSTFNASGSEHSFEIACLNGPTSHVTVSDQVSASALEEKLGEKSLRYRKLDVPFGFHSRFTEPILPGLKELAASITISEPTIQI